MTPRLFSLAARPMVLALAAVLAACAAPAPSAPRVTAADPVILSTEAEAEAALAAVRRDIDEGYSADVELEKRAVSARVEELLGADVMGAYELFIYISKAKEGPIAQHAYIYTKDVSGALLPLDKWAVSTGREEQEKSPKGENKFTTTPEGIFQFDPGRFVRLHKSNAWEADMPWAMFFRPRGRVGPTGIALHAALDKYVPNLGQRASAGCIRLLPANAERLYKVLQTQYAGPVRNLSVEDRSSWLTARLGSNAANGIKALVIVEDNDGSALIADQQMRDSGVPVSMVAN